ncbi:MAG: glycerophosphodiester phosphodiesterase [Candidatus Saccharimonadales bacterium]
MLIIGHRGAAGIAPENTIEALQAGFDSGADMLEFDVRITKDKIAILSHDARLHGKRISQTTLDELQATGNVTLLQEVLDSFFGKILLNLEFKPTKDTNIVYEMIASKYIKHEEDWKFIYISSFHVRSLFQFRRQNNAIQLALLHSINSFAFVTYQRQLHLSAVGWHRLHVNKLAIEIAKKSDIFTYVYTVNQIDAVIRISKRGVDGIVTDYPNRMNMVARR